MALFTTSRDLPLTPGAVFEFLADARNLTGWNSGIGDVDREPVVPAAGTSYRYRFPGRHRFHQLTCSVFRPPRLVEYVGERMWTPLGTQRPTYSFRIEAADGGCRVSLRVKVELGGCMGLLLPVVALGWRRDLPLDADRLHLTLTAPAEPLPDPELQPYAEPLPPFVAVPLETSIRLPAEPVLRLAKDVPRHATA
jgi:uncharacterized protein YndB with AHSA1/START domain